MREPRPSCRWVTVLGVLCGAGACLAGCADSTALGSPAPSSMVVTVSAVTDVPVTIYVDTHQQAPGGFAGPATGPTPVEVSRNHPSVTLPVRYDPGDWLRVRVAGRPDRPEGVTVGCELRAADGRVLDQDVHDPDERGADVAACAGAD